MSRLRTKVLFLLVIVSLVLLEYLAACYDVIKSGTNTTESIADKIYDNRYRSNNFKYLVWLLVLLPVIICIPCLIWVWCSDQCLQLMRYRNNMRIAKEKKIMNEIILSSLSERAMSRDPPYINTNRPSVPPHIQPDPSYFPPNYIPPMQSSPAIPYVNQQVSQPNQQLPYMSGQKPGTIFPPNSYNHVPPVHIQSTPAYIPNLHLTTPQRMDGSCVTQALNLQQECKSCGLNQQHGHAGEPFCCH